MPDRAEQEWMAHAWSYFGTHEARGARSNPVITAMYRDSGHPHVSDDAVPWCAAFVGAVLARAGHAGTGSLRARSYLDWGVATDALVPGAIAVLSRGSNPALGHVGFLVGATADALFLLGGNQSDQVNVTRFARSRLLGLRLPKTGAEDVAEESSASEADATDARFAQCLAHVLRMEGGYVNDPHDPGGPTNKGVTLATFARHTGTALSDVTRADLITALKAISDADVSAIYRDRYWRVSRAAEMPTGLDLMHFDAAVNHGPTGAVRLLQRALDVEVDGEIGPITLAAARAQSVSAIIAAYAKARRKRYRALPHFWRFGRGWLRRVDATERAARRALQAPQSDQQKGTSDMSSPETAPTALPAPTPPAKWWGQSMTLWGAFITTLATVLPVVGPMFGLNITAGLVEQVGQHVLTILQAIGGISGLVLTVFGRMRATTQLVATPPSRAHRR